MVSNVQQDRSPLLSPLAFAPKVKENTWHKYLPVMTDMSLSNPLPIYYSYCLQRNIIDLEYWASHIVEAFNCVICGEIGTARSSIAYIFYLLLMQKRHMPSFRIDCSILDNASFLRIFDDPLSPLQSSPCYLYFYELHLVPEPLQKRLYEYLSAREHLCIASTLCTPEVHISNGHLDKNLANMFSKNVFFTPSLRNNHKDIEAVSDMLLNYYNTEYGKHLLGFTPDAMQLIKQYEWPGNIRQISQLINLLVIQSSEIYISESLLRFFLVEANTTFSAQPFWLHLDMSMTLAEINRHIVECALRQENWNQAKVARRLGISRSTLWRMLRQE